MSKTLILITHNAAIARMADKVIYIRDGRVDRIEENPHPVTADEVSW